MWPVSDAYKKAVCSSNQFIRTSMQLLDRGTVIDTPGLRLISGSMTCDESASRGRRRASVVVVDESKDGKWIPNDATDVLSPYGYDFRIWWGIRLADGTWEDVPLGTFRIASSTVDGRSITLDGFDYAWVIARARFEAPYQVALGANLVTAAQALIADGFPGARFSSMATGRTTTSVLLFDQASDRMAAADDIVNQFGAEAFFDPMGVCVFRTRPNPASDPVAFTYDDEAESDNGLLFQIENTMDADPGYNGAVVDGEPPELPPVHQVVYDNAASSPTNYLGRYNRVPEFYKSRLIATDADALETAQAMLRAKQGGTEILNWTCPGNGAHDAGDIVQVKSADNGVDGVYVLASFQLGFGPNAMRATSRKRRTL